MTALAATLLVLVVAGGSAGGQVVPGDHYVCYLASDVTAGGPQNPPAVQIADQFEAGSFNPAPADRLCAPAEKNDEPVQDQLTHLKRYPISGPQFSPRTVTVTNQYGRFTIRVTGPRFLLVASSKSLVAPPAQPNPNAAGFEHYKCYTFNKAPRVQDQFRTSTIAVIAWSLCNPASINSSTIKNAERHLLCYAIAGPAPGIPNPAFLNNQFGRERLQLGQMRQFCVPSLKQEPA